MENVKKHETIWAKKAVNLSTLEGFSQESTSQEPKKQKISLKEAMKYRIQAEEEEKKAKRPDMPEPLFKSKEEYALAVETDNPVIIKHLAKDLYNKMEVGQSVRMNNQHAASMILLEMMDLYRKECQYVTKYGKYLDKLRRVESKGNTSYFGDTKWATKVFGFSHTPDNEILLWRAQ